MEKAQIAVSECKSYSVKEVYAATKTCLESLGGLKNYVSSGDIVLLKPNLLQASSPDKYITTHPAIVESVICLVKDVGGIPQVGDSPGAFERNIKKYWDATGLTDVCERLDVELVNFENSGSYHKQRNGQDYYIAKPVLDADLVINLPKIKTHSLTILTCAIKNLYGTVPGFIKTEYHKMAPQPSKFSEKVVDIYALNPPCLHIVDGVIGMDGYGPSSGDPRYLGMVLAGNDGVAMDSAITHILGRNPLKIPTNRIAHHQGLGKADMKHIEVIGDVPVVNDFKWPSNISYTIELIPGPLARGVMNLWYTRPTIDLEKCTKCLKCKVSCPTNALKKPGQLTEDHVQYIPEFDYKKCINCLCCMEMCPEKAIYNGKSLLYKFTSLFQK